MITVADCDYCGCSCIGDKLILLIADGTTLAADLCPNCAAEVRDRMTGAMESRRYFKEREERGREEA